MMKRGDVGIRKEKSDKGKFVSQEKKQEKAQNSTKQFSEERKVTGMNMRKKIQYR